MQNLDSKMRIQYAQYNAHVLLMGVLLKLFSCHALIPKIEEIKMLFSQVNGLKSLSHL